MLVYEHHVQHLYSVSTEYFTAHVCICFPCVQGVGRSVQVFAGRETSPTATATTDSSGRFCAMLQPGQYVVKVNSVLA